MTNPLKTTERIIMTGLSRVLPPCNQITRLISDGLDRKLPARQRVAVRVHLVLCKLCRRYRSQLALVRQAVSDHADSANFIGEKKLSEDARNRLREALTGEE